MPDRGLLFSGRRRHTRLTCDWSSDVCSSDLLGFTNVGARDSFVGGGCDEVLRQAAIDVVGADWKIDAIVDAGAQPDPTPDRKSTRLNSSHMSISYAVFCLKKKIKNTH